MRSNYKKEWTGSELNAVIRLFSSWEKRNLIITHGRREKTVLGTYGLPYTSCSQFASVGNTNVQAELLTDREYNFDYLVLGEKNEVIAVLSDMAENEKTIIIGKIG